MDILSHGLWGAIAFGRRNRRAFWQAFFFGIAPDFFSFGLFFIQRLFEWESSGVVFKAGPPDPAMIPEYVSSLYNITHSLVVFLVVFAVVYAITRRVFIPMLAWPLHILFDIPVHSTAFFPTPYLWPFATPFVNGYSWGHAVIFIPDVVLLTALYLWYFWYRPYKRKKLLNNNTSV